MTNTFKMIPDTLTKDARVTVSDLAVYVALLQFKNNKTGKAFPSVATITKFSRVSEKTVRKSLKHLVELGYISVQQQFKQGTSVHTSNLYTFLEVSESEITPIGGEIKEEVKEVAKATTPKKKKVIKRKTKVAAPKKVIKRKKATAPKVEETVPAEKPLVEEEVSFAERLDGILIEKEELKKVVLKELGVKCEEELDEAGAEELEWELEMYVRGEAMLRFGMFYEEELQTKLTLDELREIKNLTGGEYKKAIEIVRTMKQRIKDNYPIHSKFAYLRKSLRNLSLKV